MNLYLKHKELMEEIAFTKKIQPIIRKVAKKPLSPAELIQVTSYIRIYVNNNFNHHWEVNNFITKNNMWDKFTEIRSINNHGSSGEVKGITPHFFALVCEVLEIGAGDGNPLLDYKQY